MYLAQVYSTCRCDATSWGAFDPIVAQSSVTRQDMCRAVTSRTRESPLLVLVLSTLVDGYKIAWHTLAYPEYVA